MQDGDGELLDIGSGRLDHRQNADTRGVCDMILSSDRLPTRPVSLRWLSKGLQNVVITIKKLS